MNIKRNEVTLETKYRCCAQWVTAPVTVYFFRNPRLNFLVFFRGGGWLRMAQHEISPSYPTLTMAVYHQQLTIPERLITLAPVMAPYLLLSSPVNRSRRNSFVLILIFILIFVSISGPCVADPKDFCPDPDPT